MKDWSRSGEDSKQNSGVRYWIGGGEERGNIGHWASKPMDGSRPEALRKEYIRGKGRTNGEGKKRCS